MSLDIPNGESPPTPGRRESAIYVYRNSTPAAERPVQRKRSCESAYDQGQNDSFSRRIRSLLYGGGEMTLKIFHIGLSRFSLLDIKRPAVAAAAEVCPGSSIARVVPCSISASIRPPERPVGYSPSLPGTRLARSISFV